MHELLILRTLESEPSYSYQLARQLGMSVSSTSYSLHRLHRAGLCQPKARKNTLGPERLYFHITSKGRTMLRREAIQQLSEVRARAEKNLIEYTAHQRSIQLLREIGNV